ncbi:tRNA-uridine aminocarboxypropyltransferase [Hydrogenovibrio kuenenii]|uniref:tRNA-uridine aminocarboxypropyltransferase n=1 Tax=Hydrogenovibrio kuenenii TaxID=63658 RepID=UPI0004BAB24D|nr:tRNA-uridine aminocarboxypropyltransferase [Hydrogenovibrio kuenenii]
MARVYCTKCHRLESLCLCSVLPELDNQVEVFFLQHPLETKHIKGTAWLTHASLKNTRFEVGEQFPKATLDDILRSNKRTFLLYPATQEEDVTTYQAESFPNEFSLPDCRVLILDGTWKKTKKMLFLNPALAKLPRIVINPDLPSNYKIRKQKNAQSLSTLEATMLLLEQLERTDKYQALLKVMDALIAQYETCVENRGVE